MSGTFHRCVVAATALACAITPVSAAKKLIEFGWDEPDTAFIRTHIEEMKRTPFDGCVFHLLYQAEDGTRNFCWDDWGKRAITEEQLAPALEDLKRTRFGHFTENFVRFNVCPGDVDWFDDFSAILGNARQAARIVRAVPAVKGILFDIEQYNTQLFEYGRQAQAQSKSWDEYAAQVKLRGRELMEAFQSECPDVVIFLTFGYCLPWYQSGGRPLAEVNYGLLAPLLDGMLEAAGPRVRFVDGHEASYPYRTLDQYQGAMDLMRTGVLPIVADKDRYAAKYSFGFGVWLDMDWRGRGWDTRHLLMNYFTPAQFEESVTNALSVADEYVWIYTEVPRWWTPDGGPQDLPRIYQDVLRRVR